MTTIPPPDDPVWAHVRLRYEQDQETVQQIAETVGLHRITLSNLAKKLGWQMRSKPKAAPPKKTKPKAESTQVTIKRLKDILQQRVAQLEDQLKEIGSDVAALSSERGMRATSTLVRTIEKVLDLERKERSRRHKQTVEFKYFDDAQRQQLADKIERLQREWRGPETFDDTGEQGNPGAEQPVALLGEAGQATAAGRD